MKTDLNKELEDAKMLLARTQGVISFLEYLIMKGSTKAGG
jgi:hypothetical protein